MQGGCFKENRESKAKDVVRVDGYKDQASSYLQFLIFSFPNTK